MPPVTHPYDAPERRETQDLMSHHAGNNVFSGDFLAFIDVEKDLNSVISKYTIERLLLVTSFKLEM